MAIEVKDGGVIKPIASCKVKVDGEWKQCYKAIVKDDGEWKELWVAGGIATNVRIIATTSTSAKEVTYEGLTDPAKFTNLRVQAIGKDGNVVGEYYSSEVISGTISEDLPNDAGWFTITVYAAYNTIRYSTSYDASIVSRMIITIGKIDPVE